LGLRDPAAAFPLPGVRDDAGDRRAANRAVAVSAIGLGATGLIELLLAVLTGSVGLLGDAIHSLSDVSTSAVVFLGFRLSRRPATERYPYVARYKLVVGRRINSATLVADAAIPGSMHCPRRGHWPG
jgi:divalent metal cation (Fe/Co/Zn/Cd) transporter